MIEISYTSMIVFISVIWCLVRLICAIKNKRVCYKREIQLLLVYICIVVVARFTFFPFFTVNGEIQPLIFESEKAHQSYMLDNGMISRFRYVSNVTIRFAVQRLMPVKMRKMFYSVFLRRKR